MQLKIKIVKMCNKYDRKKLYLVYSITYVILYCYGNK